jgi:hypothetical protein
MPDEFDRRVERGVYDRLVKRLRRDRNRDLGHRDHARIRVSASLEIGNAVDWGLIALRTRRRAASTDRLKRCAVHICEVAEEDVDAARHLVDQQRAAHTTAPRTLEERSGV